MERALKERIIGAVVLVVFVVLVVPIFLDGPADESNIVSERVLLPGQEPQDTKVVVLDRERSVPIPAASNRDTATTSPSVEEPVERPDSASKPIAEPLVADNRPTAPAQSVETATPPPKPEAVEEREPAPNVVVSTPAVTESSATGMWAVQLGSFSNKDNAEALAASLRKQGYAAFLSKLNSGTKELHRVRIGPQKDRPSAEAMAARLAKVGHTGQVLPHP